MNEQDNIETLNRYGVGLRGEQVVILALRWEMSKREAVNLAAWLVALAGEDDAFKHILQNARNT